MSRLYDVGDRAPAPGTRTQTSEKRRSIVPVRAIIVALVIAGIVAWQLDRSGLLKNSEFEGKVITPNFTSCVDASSDDCVADGDSFIYQGTRIRIADVDVARTVNGACPDEAERGQRAAGRLRDLLNAGAFEIRPYPPFTDDSGEKLSMIVRGGQSLGAVLVAEGVARAWDQPTPWCVNPA